MKRRPLTASNGGQPAGSNIKAGKMASATSTAVYKKCALSFSSFLFILDWKLIYYRACVSLCVLGMMAIILLATL